MGRALSFYSDSEIFEDLTAEDMEDLKVRDLSLMHFEMAN